MQFELSPEEQMIQDTARRFATDSVLPRALSWDESSVLPADVWHELGELGFLTALLPANLDGGELSDCAFLVLIEELAAAHAGLAMAVATHNVVVPLVAEHAPQTWSDGQAHWRSGQKGLGVNLQSCQNSVPIKFTVPSESSSSAAMQKLSAHCPLYLQSQSEGLLCLLFESADQGPALVLVTEKPKQQSSQDVQLGLRGLTIGHNVCFECAMPNAQFVRAPREAQRRSKLRLILAGSAVALGLARVSLAVARDYAQERKQFGHPIADFQAVQWMLADMATEADAARLLLYQAAMRLDDAAGESLARRAESLCLKSALRAARQSLQILGGNGFVREYRVERYLRDAHSLNALFRAVAQDDPRALSHMAGL